MRCRVTTETGAFVAESNPVGTLIGAGAGYTRIISDTDTGEMEIVSTMDHVLIADLALVLGQTLVSELLFSLIIIFKIVEVCGGVLCRRTWR